MSSTSKPKKVHAGSVRKYSSLLVQYLRPQRRNVLVLAILLTGSIALQLINPQVIRYFLDTAGAGGALRLLLLAALAYIGFALFQQGLAVLATYVSQYVSWIATNRLRTDLLLHCLRLDMSFHKRHTPGELIERIDRDASELANFFSEFAIRLGGNLLLVLGILVLLFREQYWLGIGLTLYTLVTLLLLGMLQNIAGPRWATVRQIDTEETSFLEERISGAEELRAAAAEAHTLNRFYLIMRKLNRALLLAFVTGTFTIGLTNLLFALGYTAGLALGVYLYTHGQATLGTAYLVTSYVGMLSGPLQEIRRQAQNLQQASASLQRISELLRIQPAIKDPGSESVMERQIASARLEPGKEEGLWPRNDRYEAVSSANENNPRRIPLSVAFREVSFRYDDEQNGSNDHVLCNVSFDLQAGKVLGILGRTGSGKSTLARLLMRLYDPSQGSILLDGSDLRQIPLESLRKQVGMVTQDVQLFQASIRDNLTFFHPGSSYDEYILTVLRELGLQEWVQSLPQGLDTRLTGSGGGLSAGQAQLLAFTRLFLKDPGLVILDEASSRLDPASEHLLERAVERLFERRTGILIAHRLRTVQRADELLILEQGEVVEYGPRQALAEDPNSRFYHLLQTGLEEVLV